MNATTIRRGVACWLCFALFAPALYGQETTGDQTKQEGPQNSNTTTSEYVRKVRSELEAREADVKRATAARDELKAELQKLRESLDAALREKKAAEENAKRQAETAARMRELISRQLDRSRNALEREGEPARPLSEPLQERLESTRRSLEEAAKATAAGAMQRAAETLAQVAQQAEGAAAKLDPAKGDLNKEAPPEIDQGWKKLLARAEMMLTQTRRNEEAAARFLPKLESAMTQLRKAGRNEEAEQLQAEANRLLSQGRAAGTSQEQARPEIAPLEHRARDESRARVNVERAIDDLRREVEQLRREVRDLRQALQGRAGETSRVDRKAGSATETTSAGWRGRSSLSDRDFPPKFSGSAERIGRFVSATA